MEHSYFFHDNGLELESQGQGRSYSVLKRHANSYLSGKVSGSCHVCKNGKATDYFKAVQYLIGIDVGSGKAF